MEQGEEEEEDEEEDEDEEIDEELDEELEEEEGEEEDDEEVNEEDEEDEEVDEVEASLADEHYSGRSKRHVPSSSSRRQSTQRSLLGSKRPFNKPTSDIESEASDMVLRDSEGADEDQDNYLETDYNATDYSRLTERQRARLMDETLELQELPNEGTKKKIFTEDELMLRRTETARRRKNLSEKRREEEKMDTINRLLKKQAPKRKGKLKTDDELDTPFPPTTERYSTTHMYRWVSSQTGIVLGIPESLVQ
ncbi:PAPA-1-like conserved region-domain-containing protein [Lipomyces doorenjongii]|uniref:PAPA-1-like conserved region-domain-containing protein n=1 Tax=Lipomyces doorenjongii TaxID=383834 RepID=UPI0034CE0D50